MTFDRKAQEFLAEAFSRPVVIDGREMTTREAYIRGVHARALGGDVASHAELFRLRRACGAGNDSKVGHLVVPETLSMEEFERLAFEQQRPFREQSSDYDL